MRLPLLGGLKALEIGDPVAAASAGTLLAALGAEVTNVESPGARALRRLLPYWQDASGLERSILPN
jgi:crotonobetainyl-CoA:carnitine CoA-transferase CaiB-like acyl-CoA transferase